MKLIRNIAIVVFFAVFIGSLSLNIHNYTSRKEKQIIDTVRVVFVDTIPFYKPIPKDSTVIKYITHRLPVSDAKGIDSSKMDPPAKDSIIADSVNVTIPITQTIYEDSMYTAYISGYRVNLDSLIFRMPREETTITATTTQMLKPKRWSVGIQLGYGVTINSQPKFVPYIGVGISYNLFSF